ncbi:hypothetical protein [Rubrimonas cliftonensis]|uniref:Uncharacterized protein n=1 Tax=Rubrimonas cliftonensis TaxID=89524 RepID=A0A1H4EST5_9RHOB|nr:hypothetical protein [Rubrimonas cliftonensis]SEA87949.1 hypothetical protein SAMN05444370_11579 [Rubrimonas cliftonensis]
MTAAGNTSARRITVCLSEADIATLGQQKNVSGAIREALRIAAERRDPDAEAARSREPQRHQLEAIVAELARLNARVEALHDVVSTPFRTLETAARIVRIETLHARQMHLFARFLEQFCATSAAVEGLSMTAGATDANAARAYVQAAHEDLLERLFDPADHAAQEALDAARTPGSATASADELFSFEDAPTRRRAAE